VAGRFVRVFVVACLVPTSGCVVASSGRSSGWSASIFVFLPVLLVVLFVRLASGSRRRVQVQSTRPHDAPSNANLLRAELSVLADDVLRLEPQVTLKEAARDDYEAAAHRYRVAEAALDQVEEPVDLERVQRVVDEATWSMARARATLEGRPPPAPPAPLRRPGSRGEPAVELDDADLPTYVGSPDSFRAGWFGGSTGLIGGLLFGPMLGGFGGWVAAEDDGEALFDEGDTGPDSK
jgi:hypothetical protein